MTGFNDWLNAQIGKVLKAIGWLILIAFVVIAVWAVLAELFD